MYIKTSPMQDLRIYCYRYGHLENVKALMVMVPPTKVLSASADSLRRTGELFLHTCLLEKIMKCIFRVNAYYREKPLTDISSQYQRDIRLLI